tara:strand:+ start:129 stop:1157 length:1029 start_codon:yes stop_codon:yes gene_type:complete
MEKDLLMEQFIEHWKKYINEDVEESGKTLTLKIPKFRISEKWGTPGSDDRKLIEMFTKNIKGSSLSEKISSLNSFVSDCDAACASTKDVSEILANLVYLDSLASVIYDFNPMTGGFLFESLLAALFGGTARQVPTGETGSDQSVIDIYDDKGRPLSLKFFFEGGSQYITASGQNLRNDIVNEGKPVIYVIAIKNRSHKDGKVLAIDFYEFEVGSRRDGIPATFDYTDLEKYSGKSDLSTSSIIGKKRQGRRMPDEDPNVPRQRQKATPFYLGTINFGSRQEIQQIANNYVERMGSLMYEIYQQLDLLSTNVNTYFLSSPDSKDSALKARQNAEILKKDTEEL